MRYLRATHSVVASRVARDAGASGSVRMCGRHRAAEPIRPELATSLTPAVPLEEGWRNPPIMARTRCWWWWLNGNVTKEAITRDLEAMAAKGLRRRQHHRRRRRGSSSRTARAAWPGLWFAGVARIVSARAARGGPAGAGAWASTFRAGGTWAGRRSNPKQAAKKLTLRRRRTVEGGKLVERQSHGRGRLPGTT